MRRARLGIASRLPSQLTRARRNSSPRHDTPMPTKAKTTACHPVRGEQRAKISDDKQSKDHAQRGGDKSRPPTAECRGDQDCRDEEQVRALAVQHIGERQLGGKAHRDGKDRNAIVPSYSAPGGRRQFRRGCE